MYVQWEARPFLHKILSLGARYPGKSQENWLPRTCSFREQQGYVQPSPVGEKPPTLWEEESRNTTHTLPNDERPLALDIAPRSL